MEHNKQDKNTPESKPNDNLKPPVSDEKQVVNQAKETGNSTTTTSDNKAEDAAEVVVEQTQTKHNIQIVERDKPRLGITIGDLNGISVEVIIKTFQDARILDYCTPIIYGSSRVFSYYRKVLRADDFTYNIINRIDKVKPNVCNVLNCWTDEVNINIGKARPDIAPFVLRAIESAVYDISRQEIDAIVTAPVNKAVLNSEQLHFVGHTEYITQKFNVKDSLMFLVNDDLRVGLVTNHVPISKVSERLNGDLVSLKLFLMEKSLKQDFGIVRPKIAVLGLNPHAGDNGLIGTEEKDYIKAVVEEAKTEGILAFGPYAADGFFGSGMYRQFDGVLAMYHDQGLVPFKTLSFGKGVNFTAGLPIVRTSPDHGTAYDIAGKNIASPDSFRQSVFLALDILKSRKKFVEMNANPMQRGLADELEREHRALMKQKYKNKSRGKFTKPTPNTETPPSEGTKG
ncbi:MAG: 4-hydroxythreonine-4-phosphate dehydrogenase PdxA [Chitinophagales bacterium]